MLQERDKFFRRAYDKKLSAVGLATLLALPASALPAVVASSLPTVRPSLLAGKLPHLQ